MVRGPRIASLGPRIAVADLRTAHAPPKASDPYYQTAEHRTWRELVIRRAGGRCEAIRSSTGLRCEASEASGQRMFADHIDEIADGGARFDPANGQCLCGHHHTLKTNVERARRHAASGKGVNPDSIGDPDPL
jgi:5-methylcytosine-specific restriction protein A